ncbi:hypothetical protein [Rhodococcus tibetensis]|uniref:Integral membrane protein n=1 Tax=Rhodococcus tibetensis TaxID=2965064 RepID=A0ABT1Q7P4_9NOCA|nr:hypothetical protein [Rhodococcus sp. FXJ9.536]MCQ4118276.1 hypothetical protein [Rhodococcus sp. FXJ9.536]
MHTIVEEGRARAPSGSGSSLKVLVGGHLALGAATVVTMVFSLAFLCTLDNGNDPWTWPARYSSAWYVCAAILATTAWALLVTGVLIFRPGRRRGLGTATFFVAVALGIAAVVGLFGPNSALQLWLVCAINLAYQAAHLRSV